MFKPPKGIKYGVISKEELERAMLNDPYLLKLMQKRLEAKAKVEALADKVKERKAVHRKSFWSLWKAESQLIKEKMRRTESDAKSKTGWQKRCWEIFKILKVRKVRDAQKKKN